MRGLQSAGRDHYRFPFSIEEETIEPIYAELPGWKTDMTGMKSTTEFPKEFIDYITFLERELATPITIVSIGPDREQTICASPRSRKQPENKTQFIP